VRLLRAAGHDVPAIVTDSPGVSDREVLKRAVREERIILTFDRDFGELLFRSRLPSPRGVVYFRHGPATPEEPADSLIRILAIAGLALEGEFTTVEPGQVRQRPLAS